jgi:hypothetical protein
MGVIRVFVLAALEQQSRHLPEGLASSDLLYWVSPIAVQDGEFSLVRLAAS